jgi:benzil reductase ((S)-benzoin forming)
MLDLIIISGASRGIGLNIAKDLSSISKTIIGIGSSAQINKVELPNKKCKYIPFLIDLCNYEGVERGISSIIRRIDPDPETIGIVLCGAAVGEYGGIFDNDLEHWNKLYQINVLGNLAIIKACEEDIKTGKTRIVFFSGGGAAGPFEFGGYALSKTAVVRAVENLGVEFEKNKYDASIIALAPGAVETDMLAKVKQHGGTVKTITDISEPTNFVRKFLTDEFDAKNLNGRFIHCRDIISNIDFNKKDILKLRRIE